MPKTSKKNPTADEIAEMASRGENISAFFTNKFTVVRPVRRVNVDLTQGMLRELDARRSPEHQPASGDKDVARNGAPRGARQQALLFELTELPNLIVS